MEFRIAELNKRRGRLQPLKLLPNHLPLSKHQHIHARKIELEHLRTQQTTDTGIPRQIY